MPPLNRGNREYTLPCCSDKIQDCLDRLGTDRCRCYMPSMFPSTRSSRSEFRRLGCEVWLAVYLRRFRENVGKGGSTRGAATVKVVADPARKVSAKYSRLLLFLRYILKLPIYCFLTLHVCEWPHVCIHHKDINLGKHGTKRKSPLSLNYTRMWFQPPGSKIIN